MIKFIRQRKNPMDLIEQFFPYVDVANITYDPKLIHGQFNITRQHSHDGTLLFTYELIKKTLYPIVYQSISLDSLYNEKDFDKIEAIKYTIGTLKYIAVFGEILLPRLSTTHKYPGQRERTILPVISTIIYKDKLWQQ